MEAESIGDILSTASIQQHSGLLNAECAIDGHLEKGEIYLLAGQPIYAHLGKLSGQRALEYMLTWRKIRFSFTADAPRPPANLSSRMRNPSLAPPNTLPQVSSRLPAIRDEKQRGTGIERLIPQKIGPPQYALSLPLAYHQRLIYFLIDGQRTVADLSRCSNKSVTEIEAILRELHQIGLIVVFASNS